MLRPPTLIERLADSADVGTASLQIPGAGMLQLQQAPWDEAGTGGMVWPAASVLCEWLRENHAGAIRGANILEVGCGTGACGLFVAGVGAARVLMTDGSEEVLLLADKNIKANRTAVARCDVRTQRLPWGPRYPPPPGPWNFVLASDCAYTDERWQALAATVRKLLQQQPASPPRVFMSQQHRTASNSLLSGTFVTTLRASGLRAILCQVSRDVHATVPAADGSLPEHRVTVTVLELKLAERAG